MKISEIKRTDILRPATWNAKFLNGAATFMLYVVGERLFQIVDNDYIFYVLIEDGNDDNLLAMITTHGYISGYEKLVRLENKSKISGLITAMLSAMVVLNKKFILAKNEELTPDGLEWLIKLLQSNRHKLKITSIDGSIVDINSLEKDWCKDSGEIGILIENISTGNHKIFEHHSEMIRVKKGGIQSLLMPYVDFVGDDTLP